MITENFDLSNSLFPTTVEEYISQQSIKQKQKHNAQSLKETTILLTRYIEKKKEIEGIKAVQQSTIEKYLVTTLLSPFLILYFPLSSIIIHKMNDASLFNIELKANKLTSKNKV